jgi:hypothetical protein
MARRGQYKHAGVLTEEFLRQKYLAERQSSVDIAAEVHIDDATIRNYLKRYRNQDSNVFVLPLSGRRENLLAFADMMYQGSTVSLPRKKAIFDSLRESDQLISCIA